VRGRECAEREAKTRREASGVERRLCHVAAPCQGRGVVKRNAGARRDRPCSARRAVFSPARRIQHLERAANTPCLPTTTPLAQPSHTPSAHRWSSPQHSTCCIAQPVGHAPAAAASSSRAAYTSTRHVALAATSLRTSLQILALWVSVSLRARGTSQASAATAPRHASPRCGRRLGPFRA
jgi:hypothetical protein